MLTIGEKLTAFAAVLVVDVALVLAGGLFFLFPAAIASLPFTVTLLTD
jgi:hypothetical protein